MTILCFFNWFIVAVLGLIIYKIIIQPLLSILYYKWLYGDKVICYYFPLIGAANLMVKGMKLGKPFHYQMELKKKYPNAKVLIGIGLITEFYILDIDMQKEIMLPPQYVKFGKKRSVFLINNTIARGMIFSDGQFWKNQRQVLSNAFHFDALRNRVPYMVQTSIEIMQEMQEKVKENEPQSLINWCERITGEIIVRTFFGKQFINQTINGTNITLELANAFSEIGDYNFTMTKYLKQYLFGVNYWDKQWACSADEKRIIRRAQCILKAVTDIIEQRMAQYESGEIKAQEGDNAQKMFLDIILDHYFMQKEHKPEDKRDVVQQFMTFFFAGMDTTGVTTGQSLYRMCKNPEIMKRVQEELRRVIPEDGNAPEKITPDHLSKLEYVQAVAKETLRMASPVSMLVPKSVLEDCVVGGWLNLKAGQTLMINSNLAAVNDQHFKDPDVYNPERWLTDEWKSAPPYAYIPFSAGPRNCIGQHMAMFEIKVMIAFILSNFNISITDDQLMMKQAILLQPRNDKLFLLKSKKTRTNSQKNNEEKKEK